MRRAFALLFVLSLQACSYQRLQLDDLPPVPPVEYARKEATKAAVDSMVEESNWTYLKSGPEVTRVDRIMSRLMRAVPVSKGYWPVYVVDAGDDVNASAVNKTSVIVYSKLVQKLSDDNRLAAILAHEIGHLLAQHDNTEQDQRSGWLSAAGAVLGTAASIGASIAGAGSLGSSLAGDATETVTDVVGYGAFIGAYDREQEYEADEIGLMLMAKAGYDPAQAVELWKNAEEVFGAGSGWSFLSTHPDAQDRGDALAAALPRVQNKYPKRN